MNSVGRLQAIKQAIQKCQEESALAAKEIKLIAVSKTHPASSIIPLIEAGQKAFGENRVQEAADKWPAIREQYPDIELHLIGSLQTNKVKEALSLFDVIQTVDRPSLVDAFIKESRKTGAVRCRTFYVQVNTGEEAQKGGVKPGDLKSLMDYINTTGLYIVGLMCVPPVNVPSAPHFALLYELAREFNLPELSMGMSGDYETAIRLGATNIRIGTALFGKRLT